MVGNAIHFSKIQKLCDEIQKYFLVNIFLNILINIICFHFEMIYLYSLKVEIKIINHLNHFDFCA